MPTHTVISRNRNCWIDLIHRTSDPGSWIVRRWRRILWFKRLVSSEWFANEEQALVFAKRMIQEHEQR